MDVLMCRRTARNLSRDRMGVLMRLSQNLIYGLFVAFFVMRLDIDVSKGAVQDRIGIIYQSIGASPYTGMLNAVALCEFARHIHGHIHKWFCNLGKQVDCQDFLSTSARNLTYKLF